MAQRGSELIGKSVVSADTGERLGTVSDILLDESDHRLVGLIVKRGLMKTEHVLPAAAVQTYGRDAVVSRNAQELVTAKDWRAKSVAGTSVERSTPESTHPERLSTDRDLM